MVIQTANPFKPATPRVPIAPRRLKPSLPGPGRNSKANKTRCPKCTSLLRVNFDEA